MGLLGGGAGGERVGGDGISMSDRRELGGVDAVRPSFCLVGGGGSGLFVVAETVSDTVGRAGKGFLCCGIGGRGFVMTVSLLMELPTSPAVFERTRVGLGGGGGLLLPPPLPLLPVLVLLLTDVASLKSMRGSGDRDILRDEG